MHINAITVFHSHRLYPNKHRLTHFHTLSQATATSLATSACTKKQTPKYVHCTSFPLQYKTYKNNLKHSEGKQNQMCKYNIPALRCTVHSSLLFVSHANPFCSMYILDSEAAMDFASSSSRFFCICECLHQPSYSGLGRQLSSRTS